MPRRADAAPDRARYYTVVDAHPSSGGSSVELVPPDTEMGRYSGRSPYQAARKAASKLYRLYAEAGVEAKEFFFGLREQTRNAPRVVRLYSATREELPAPVPWPSASAEGGVAVRTGETRVRAVLDSDEVPRVLAIMSSKKNSYNTLPNDAAAGAAPGPGHADPARPD